MDGELRAREDNDDWSDGSRGLPTFGQVLRTLRQARRLRGRSPLTRFSHLLGSQSC